MYGYVYKITNIITNKSYVGKHKYPKKELDPKYFASGLIINESLNKYGRESFIIELLDISDTLKELNSKEIYYISKFNTYIPNGYNMTSGGDGAPDLSQESIEKMKYWKGKKQSIETKSKRNNSLKQIPHDKEWTDKISASLKGKAPAQNVLEAATKRLKNSSWYNNGNIEVMLENDKDIPYGFIKGRMSNPFKNSHHKYSEEFRKSMSCAKSGAVWVNNGSQEKFVKVENVPEGFVRGRLKKSIVNS